MVSENWTGEKRARQGAVPGLDEVKDGGVVLA